MKKIILILPFFIVNLLFFISCNSNNSSAKKEEKPVLYADARLDMIQNIAKLNNELESKIKVLKEASKKDFPEKEKIILSLETIDGFLQKRHSDFDEALEALKYIKQYSKRFKKEIIPQEQIKEIEEIIYMMSTYPNYG